LKAGVDFNVPYCFENPKRDIEAVEAKQKVGLAKSGVDGPGSTTQERPERSRTDPQAGKAKTGSGNKRQTSHKTGVKVGNRGKIRLIGALNEPGGRFFPQDE